jgi:type IV secretory pathway VirB10-like protein
MTESHLLSLAADSSDLVGFLAFLVIAAIGAIYNWLTNQKKAEEEARQREALERRRRELAAQQAQEPAEQDEDDTPVIWPTPTATPTPQPRTEAPRMVRRSPYVKRTTPQPAATRAAQAADQSRVRVDEELRRQQQRLEQEELERQHRLAEYRPPESDEVAIASRIVHVQPKTAVVAAGSPESGEFRVDLQSAAAARSAIIFSEILGRPKALRHGDEMWDA